MRSDRLVAGVLLILCAAAEARAADVPRYQFSAGRRITWSSDSLFKSGDAKETRSTGEMELTVLRVNADDSARVIVRFIPAVDEKKENPDEPKLYYADVFPDGRVVHNDLLDLDSNISSALPRLPADAAEMAGGWKAQVVQRVEEITFRPAASSSPDDFAFTADVGGVMRTIYRFAQKRTYHFDRSTGAIASWEITFGPEETGKIDGTITTRLKSDVTLPAAAVTNLSGDLDKFIETKVEYRRRMEELEKASSEKAEPLAKGALDLLTSARGKVKEPAITVQIEQLIKNHTDYATDARETAETFAKILGKPSADWSTTDIDAKPVKLTDFRGKVLVMDFWYRGCGFCMFAMPQVKQLAEDYKDEPVAIVSMNTDRDVADAKFVIEKLRLKHPTIRAEGIDDKYGITGFPTIVIVDQDGVVRHTHVGYSPRLRQQIGNKIDELLTAKSSAPGAGK
jgi:thiol-disulfide isomerase/thioredoxin